MLSTLPELVGLNVLCVEDDAIVSIVIEDLLEDLGCKVVGPFADLEPALNAAQTAEIDFGLLDIHLRGNTSFAIAEVLNARGTPFMFTSGYDLQSLPLDKPDWRLCRKPFRERDLALMMSEQLRSARVELVTGRAER